MNDTGTGANDLGRWTQELMTRSVKCLTHKVVKLFKGAIYVDAFSPNVLTLFLNYLHEISFNPKMLS